MTISVVNKNTLCVTVTADEQAAYGLDYDTMAYSDTATRRFCEKIIKQAEHEMGFGATHGRLLVEARREADGNVTLTLTRHAKAGEMDEDYLCQTVVFNDSSGLLDGARMFVCVRRKLVYSHLYAYRKRFYLYFELLCTQENANRVLRNVLEYGERTTVHKDVLEEHGTCVCRDDAVQRLLKAFT